MNTLNSRQKQAIKTRFRITEVAIELFKEQGYDSVKIQDICEAAGISVGAFYHHFKSKENMFATAYKQIELLIEDHVSNKVYKSALDRLYDFIDQALIIVEDLGPVYISQVYRQLLVVHDDYMLSEERYTFVNIKEIVTELINAHTIESTLPVDSLTHMFIRFQRGIIFDWCLYGGAFDLRKHSKRELELIIKGLLAVH